MGPPKWGPRMRDTHATSPRLVPHDTRENLVANEPTILIVVRGILRVSVEGKRFELGPCTMIYLPKGAEAHLSAPWGDALIYTMEGFDMGPEPRILYNGYGVKSPDGRAALCVRVDTKGVRLMLPARVYPTLEKGLLVEQDGARKAIEEGEELHPPAKLVVEKGGMHVLLVLEKIEG